MSTSSRLPLSIRRSYRAQYNDGTDRYTSAQLVAIMRWSESAAHRQLAYGILQERKRTSHR